MAQQQQVRVREQLQQQCRLQGVQVYWREEAVVWPGMGAVRDPRGLPPGPITEECRK